MEQRENQRVLLTKQLLQNAFLKQLKTTPIHAVSIRSLCAEAGINRTTFYNHYSSQYDLLADITRRFLDSIAACLPAAAEASRAQIQQRVVLVLQYLEDNPELSALLLNNSVDPDFAQRLLSLPQITDLLNAALSDCGDALTRRATVDFAIYGSFRLLQDWVNDPARISPEAQAELMLRLARRVCTGG